MNVLSFRLSSWYSSGVFVLVVVILTLIYAVVSDGVSPLITTLLSSTITLLVLYGDNNGYNDLLIVLGIKFGVYGFGGYSPGIYGFPI